MAMDGNFKIKRGRQTHSEIGVTDRQLDIKTGLSEGMSLVRCSL